MKTQIVEATNREQNWGKFLVGQFDEAEWAHTAHITSSVYNLPPSSLLRQRGWAIHHRLVLDIEAGEALVVSPGGSAHADLQKRQIYVCPLFEPFLEWWYENWPTIDVGTFPAVVQLPDAAFSMYGYRRPGNRDL